MENKLTIIEIRYIRSLAAIKTDEELALMIEKPVELIKAQFALMAGLPKRPVEKPATIAKLLSTNCIVPEPVAQEEKKTKKHEKEKQSKKNHSAHAQALDRQKIRKDRQGKSIYATKKLDLTGKVPFKLNNRTTVYAPPGTDIDQLKIKYKIA